MNRLQEFLLLAGGELDVKVIAPYLVELESGTEFMVDALIPEIGNVRGMLVTQYTETYRGLEKQLVHAGFGYTSYREPKANEIFDAAAYAEMFKEWGLNEENSRKRATEVASSPNLNQPIGGFPSHQVRGPEVHPSSGSLGESPHAHLGEVHHIPILDSSEEDHEKDYLAEKLSGHSVVITSFDPRFKIRGIKVIRDETGMGLAVAKNFIESLPGIIKTGLNSRQADNLAQRLNQAHLETEIKFHD